MKDADVVIIITSLIVFFFILGAGITIFVLFYYKKRSQHQKEKQEIQQGFERSILQSQIEIQQQTFNAISQEIHDNVGQVLSLSKVQLNIIETTWTPLPPMFFEVKENLTKAMSDLRDIAKSISSERLQLLSFSKAVEQEIERINRTNLIHGKVIISGNEVEIDSQKKMVLFRVVQESLQNILKHASATEISIYLNYTGDHLLVNIEDNGKGFNVDENIAAGKGLGLQNIFSRTKFIGAQARIESSEKGTKIFLGIPYN